MRITMNAASTEQKLELIQQIRAQYNKDQFDMNHREQILYGRSMPRNTYEPMSPVSRSYEYYASENQDTYMEHSTFKFRLLLAGFLFVMIVALDSTGNKFAGIETGTIFEALAENYEDKVDSWVESLQEK